MRKSRLVSGALPRMLSACVGVLEASIRRVKYSISSSDRLSGDVVIVFARSNTTAVGRTVFFIVVRISSVAASMEAALFSSTERLR